MSVAPSPPTQSPRAAVSVDELKRAWAAIEAGQFRRRQPAGTQTTRTAAPARDETGWPGDDAHVWTPALGERVLGVVGCGGSAGTTTVALAVALSAGIPARVVECCSVTASGLAAASNAELGLHESGWRQGKRDRVLLERASEVLVGVHEVPMPTTALTAEPTQRGETLTVLDIGWELGQLLAIPSWLNETIGASRVLIVVAPATVPGLRRLESALEMLGAHRTIAALVGPRFKKWPKGVAHSAGPNTRLLLDQGRFVEVPEDRSLALAGLDSTPLPAPLLQAAVRLLDHTLLPRTSPTTNTHDSNPTEGEHPDEHHDVDRFDDLDEGLSKGATGRPGAGR